MGSQLNQNVEVQCSRKADGRRCWQEGERRGLSSGSGGGSLVGVECRRCGTQFDFKGWFRKSQVHVGEMREPSLQSEDSVQCKNPGRKALEEATRFRQTAFC